MSNSSTVLFSEIVAAVDPDRDKPEPGYLFSNGRTFAAGSYPKDDNNEPE